MEDSYIKQTWLKVPRGDDLRLAWRVVAVVDVYFLMVYPAVNYLTARRESHYAFYLKQELQIPLWPGMVWVYLSLFLLMGLTVFTIPAARAIRECVAFLCAITVSAGLWLLFPARLGFERTLPDGYKMVYDLIFILDQPHNLMPSLHVGLAMLCVLAVGVNASTIIRGGLGLWFVAIVAATLLTHQHHFADVIIGIMVALFSRHWSYHSPWVASLTFATRSH